MKLRTIFLTAGMIIFYSLAMSQQRQRQSDPLVEELRTETDSLKREVRIAAVLASDDEASFRSLVRYYSSQRQTKEAENVMERALVKFPKGSFAMTKASNALRTQPDPEKQAMMLAEMLRNFPDQAGSADIAMNHYSVANAYAANKQPEKALAYLNRIKEDTSYNNYLAIIVEQIASYDAAQAGRIVKEGIGNSSPTTRGYYRLVSLYGDILAKQKKFEEALQYTKIAYDQPGRKEALATLNYPWLLAAIGKQEEALPLLQEMMEKGTRAEEVLEYFKKSYVTIHGEAAYNAYIAALTTKKANEMLAKVKEMLIDEPAPMFAVTDVNGNTVSLSDFEGKTLVLDFWATWCGPCKASFPSMQQAVDKYKDDPSVKFLFIHTWERADNPTEDAKKYLADNDYRFDLYMDVKDPETKTNKAVAGFGIGGIPAKFVIDGRGHIRFKKLGYTPGEDTVGELSAMIHMAKNN